MIEFDEYRIEFLLGNSKKFDSSAYVNIEVMNYGSNEYSTVRHTFL
jgi:hypothetical protein